MNRKKVCSLCLALILLCGMFAGCSNNDRQQSPAGQASQPEGQAAAPSAQTPEPDLLSKSWEEVVAQAKEENGLSLWVWSDEVFWRQIADMFENKYGIKVSIMVSDKNTVLNKVLAEKDGAIGSVDVMGLPGDIINTLVASDVLYGKVLTAMPNRDLLDPLLCARNEGVPCNDMWVPIWRNFTGILYNPQMIAADTVPQTWEELEQWIDANPKQFGFCIPEKGGSGQSMMQTVIVNMTGGLEQYLSDTEVDPAKTEKWDVVWQWLNERKDKITFTTSNNDSISRLNQGEISMTVAWDSNVFSTIQAGELFKDVGYYMPEFGLVGGGDVQTVLKNAPHPAAALLWLDFMTSEEGQNAMMETIKCFPARVDMTYADTLLTPEDLENAIEWMPAVYKAYYIEEFTKNVLMN